MRPKLFGLCPVRPLGCRCRSRISRFRRIGGDPAQWSVRVSFWGRPRFFGGGGGMMGVFARTRSGMRYACCRSRWLAPSIRTAARWSGRSRSTVATTAPKISPHSAKPLFKAGIIALSFATRVDDLEEEACAASVMGRQPIMWTMRSAVRARKRIFRRVVVDVRLGRGCRRVLRGLFCRRFSRL